MNALIEFLTMGGPVVWVLLSFSIIALSISLLKAAQFWLQLKISNSNAETALAEFEKGHISQALMMVNGRTNPRDEVISHMLHLLENTELNIDTIKDETIRKARSMVKKLSRYLRALEVIATLSPLLGLLGTVLGMITAFQAMEAAGAQVNPAILSGGIWQALFTTAVGLIVAIPVSLAHSGFESRVETEAAAIQDDLQKILTIKASFPRSRKKQVAN